MPDLSPQIEAYLLEKAAWVPSQELIERFGLKDDRMFRAVGNQPGLCTRFAISRDGAFRHVATATPGEWLHFKHRMRRHAILELIRTRFLDRRRHDAVKTVRPGITFERDSGQVLLPI